MTFKEFESWCNDRAADGCWGIVTAIICIDNIVIPVDRIRGE